jgi:hypothetical protein
MGAAHPVCQLFCFPDHWLQTALCLRHRSANPQRPCLDQRFEQIHGGNVRLSGTWLCRKVHHPWLGGPRRLTMYLAGDGKAELE